MKILIACEYSGRVRNAFAALGHDVISADFEPAEDDSPYHYQGDCFDLIKDQHFDLMIAHPPCTYLSVSGMHWTSRGLRDPQLTEDALAFVRRLLDAPIPKIALENPISVISTRIRPPDQIIQPWMFGEDASKKTCLWLKGLPKLTSKSDDVVPPKGWHKASPGSGQEGITYKQNSGVGFYTDEQPPPKQVWGNQTPSGQNKLGPSKDRWKERSRTYEGIAKAMAEQWST